MIITGTDANGIAYRLSLTKTRLRQCRALGIYVELAEFNNPDGGNKRFAKLRTKLYPHGWCLAHAVFRPKERRIGCTTFDKPTWAKIMAAIKALKRGR